MIYDKKARSGTPKKKVNNNSNKRMDEYDILPLNALFARLMEWDESNYMHLRKSI